MIKLGRYTEKKRTDNLTECQQLQHQFSPTWEASNTQRDEQAYDDDDSQIENFIGIIVQAHHNRLPNITDHLHQVAIINKPDRQ